MISSQSSFTLCFDGASKGNPGEVGVGGGGVVWP
jgi:ribonuclease HI